MKNKIFVNLSVFILTLIIVSVPLIASTQAVAVQDRVLSATPNGFWLPLRFLSITHLFKSIVPVF